MSAEETAIERIEKNLKTVENKVDSINTALYGTGNPHGGLFGKFEGMEGKFTALDVKIDGVKETLIEKITGVESKLESKIDGVNEKFDKMFSFAKWVVGGLAGTVVIFAIPIFIEIVLPIIRKWMTLGGAGLALIWTATTAQAQLYIDVYPSQDNDNQTIWIFHGVSAAGITTSIRSSGNYHARDSWKIATRDHGVGPNGPESRILRTNFYNDNKP